MNYILEGCVNTLMTEMTISEIKKFLMKSTFTAKLATVKKDGSPHVVPIWFVLDDQKVEQDVDTE
jgi:nitroimidazol reductase NimA-like FMN-containing flavoprotein (pyridoxamine 5'-phosphate oxidase superfamily)